MNPLEQARFSPLYEQMQQALLLQGKRPKTIDAYSRAVRRVAGHFNRCPENLTADELKGYFASLVVSHFWSTVKLERPDNASANPALPPSLAVVMVSSSSTATS